MKIPFPAEALTAIRNFALADPDCEQLSGDEFVLDLYDLDEPATLDILIQENSVLVEGAAYLAFDEEMDGWYMSDSIEDINVVKRMLEAIWQPNSENTL